MIRRTNRFHGLGSLGFLLRRGKTVRSADLSLRFVLNTRRESFRASVAVSRKVSKSAVVRNRIRRRLYEVLRGYESIIDKPYDLLFVCHKASLAESPLQELQNQVESLLQQSGVTEDTISSVKTSDHAIVGSKEKIQSNVHDTDRPADL